MIARFARKTEALGRAKRKGVGGKEFLPACLGFALKFFERADGGAEIRKEENKAVKTLAPPSRARVFDILLPTLTNLWTAIINFDTI